jgi:hypothetical protein
VDLREDVLAAVVEVAAVDQLNAGHGLTPSGNESKTREA